MDKAPRTWAGRLGGIVFASGTWLIMTKVLVPRVPSLQRRPALGPALSLPDSAGTGGGRPGPFGRKAIDDPERAG